MSEIDFNAMERLVGLMKENDLNELDYKCGDLEITLKRGGSTVMAPLPMMAPPTAQVAVPTVPTTHQPAIDELAGMLTIKSPMVGTYYSSSSPDTPPFVKPGDRVSAESTVCIIEAMKVFNEIKAEIQGTIERVLVSNTQAVEYGQPLFLVRPD
ncbi:MAG: hypothetical protein HJJLKODD_02601 [Phycisphaerae bacterium]|nr:hypothetical protein [Phycisphaerae bacterium]